MKLIIMAIFFFIAVSGRVYVLDAQDKAYRPWNDVLIGDKVLLLNESLPKSVCQTDHGILVSTGWGIEGSLAVVELECYSNILTMGPKPQVWFKYENLEKIPNRT